MRNWQSSKTIQRFTSTMLVATLVGTSALPLAVAQQQPAASQPRATAPAPAPAAGNQAGTEAPATAPAPTQAPAPAAVPDEATRKAAREAYGAGEAATEAGDFATAYASYNKAYELIPSPHAEYKMAVSLDSEGGKGRETLAAYKLFASNPKASMVGQEAVETANARIAELEAVLLGAYTLESVPAGATVSVDGALQPGVSPMVLKLEPGSHQLSVSAEGYQPLELELQVEAGAAVTQTVELQPLPPPPPPEPAAAPPPPPPPAAAPVQESRSMVPAYVTLGIAGAGAAVGGIFGFKALSAKNDFDDNPTTDKADEVERNALIADMAFGVALTLGITGIVLLTAPDEEAPAGTASLSKSQLEVAPYASPDGGGAAARWTF